MSFIGLLVVIVVIGVIVWLVQQYVPMPPAFKTMILVVGIIFALYLVLASFGLLPELMRPIR